MIVSEKLRAVNVAIVLKLIFSSTFTGLVI